MFLKVTTAVNHPSVSSHPDSEVSDVDSPLQGRSGLFFSHLGDEVLGVVGGLRLHGCPYRSGHTARLSGRSSWRVVDHPQSDVVAGFLSLKRSVKEHHFELSILCNLTPPIVSECNTTVVDTNPRSVSFSTVIYTSNSVCHNNDMCWKCLEINMFVTLWSCRLTEVKQCRNMR